MVSQQHFFETLQSPARARAICVPVKRPSLLFLPPVLCVGHTYRSDETELHSVERIYEESGFKTKFQVAQNILETLP